jgi:hypothetical protein
VESDGKQRSTSIEPNGLKSLTRAGIPGGVVSGHGRVRTSDPPLVRLARSNSVRFAEERRGGLHGYSFDPGSGGGGENSGPDLRTSRSASRTAVRTTKYSTAAPTNSAKTQSIHMAPDRRRSGPALLPRLNDRGESPGRRSCPTRLSPPSCTDGHRRPEQRISTKRSVRDHAVRISGRRGHRFKSGYPDHVRGHIPSRDVAPFFSCACL